MWPLSEDTNEVVLLCAWFAGERECLPLTLQEYNLLASWLYQQELRPRDLRDLSCLQNASESTGLSLERLTSLLHRRISLGFYLEDWKRRGIWIIGRGDDAYPQRIHHHLRALTPPLLFGSGEPSLLGIGGTTVTGPSQSLPLLDNFIPAVAELCIEHQRTMIIAGNDEISTQLIASGVDHGGVFIWLRQAALLGAPLDKPCRHAKAVGNLTLLSSRSPADLRSFPEEPEIGLLLVALGDDVIYIDGTELSIDGFDAEAALLQSLPEKKCFIYGSDPKSSLAQTLLSNGAQPWIDEEIAMDAGLFTSSQRTEIQKKAPTAHETVESNMSTEIAPPSSEAINRKQSIPCPDDETPKVPTEPIPQRSNIEAVCHDGVQGELFNE